jgi:hypothetical protein
MERHIQILGILHIVCGALSFLAGCAAFVIFFGIGEFVGSIEDFPGPAQDNAPAILAVIGAVIACMLVILSIPDIVGGIGLIARKEWARILLLIVAFFELLFVPLGTLLGIYTIWVLFNNDTIRLFRHPPLRQPAET